MSVFTKCNFFGQTLVFLPPKKPGLYIPHLYFYSLDIMNDENSFELVFLLIFHSLLNCMCSVLLSVNSMFTLMYSGNYLRLFRIAFTLTCYKILSIIVDFQWKQNRVNLEYITDFFADSYENGEVLNVF